MTIIVDCLPLTTRSTWHTPVSAAFAGTATTYFLFPFEAFKKLRQGGLPLPIHPSEWYRGSTQAAMGTAIATMATMSFDRALKSSPGYDHSSLTLNSISPAISGVLGTLVGAPFENVISFQQFNKTSSAEAIRIMSKQGIARFYVGLPALSVREAGFAGVMLCGMDTVKKRVLKYTNNEMLAEISGVGVGLVGAAFTHPFDTVATVQQKSNGHLSSTQAVQQIYASRGPLGFFRGLGHRSFLFTAYACGISKIQKQASSWLNSDTFNPPGTPV